MKNLTEELLLRNSLSPTVLTDHTAQSTSFFQCNVDIHHRGSHLQSFQVKAWCGQKKYETPTLQTHGWRHNSQTQSQVEGFVHPEDSPQLSRENLAVLALDTLKEWNSI